MTRTWLLCAAVTLAHACVVAQALAQTQTQTASDPRRSGYADMSPPVQAMQRDDTQNPASLWVADGQQRFAADCARCHDAGASANAASAASAAGSASTPPVTGLRGVAARYPAFDAVLGKPVTLAGRIGLCRQRYGPEVAPLAVSPAASSAGQAMAPAAGPTAAPGAASAAESDTLLALEAYVARQSRGLPIAPPADARLAPFRARGLALFNQRMGQLDFSCAQCHDGAAGRRLAGSTIPQGHPTAYPIYRLEWQGMGSLQRRLRGCLSGVRAEPFAYGSDELTAIELHLMQRAAGMPLESPGVRP